MVLMAGARGHAGSLAFSSYGVARARVDLTVWTWLWTCKSTIVHHLTRSGDHTVGIWAWTWRSQVHQVHKTSQVHSTSQVRSSFSARVARIGCSSPLSPPCGLEGLSPLFGSSCVCGLELCRTVGIAKSTAWMRQLLRVVSVLCGFQRFQICRVGCVAARGSV